nr:reverse transcriptase domain-containing protein [Tanacetum cinerariifolium]
MGLEGITKVAMGWFLGRDQVLDCKGEMVPEGIYVVCNFGPSGLRVFRVGRKGPSTFISVLQTQSFTRSSARNLFPPLDNPELTIRIRSRVDLTLLNDFEMAAEGNGGLPVPNLRTMEELCQPSLNGWGGPIAPIAIQATNFRLKNDMIQQVQNSYQFHGLLGDDANKSLDKFLHGGPIALIAIQATNFGLKNDMIQQVQNSYQFHGLSGDDANKSGTFMERRPEECYDLIENMTAHHNDWDTSA